MGSCVDLNADAVNSWASRKASVHALLKRLLSAATVFLPGIAGAEYKYNFPEPVTEAACGLYICRAILRHAARSLPDLR